MPQPHDRIDTRGRLPSGEEFHDITGLKRILTTSQRRVVLRNFVERTMSYALARRLMVYDRPVIESITDHMDATNGTWRDLFVAWLFSALVIAPVLGLFAWAMS